MDRRKFFGFLAVAPAMVAANEVVAAEIEPEYPVGFIRPVFGPVETHTHTITDPGLSHTHMHWFTNVMTAGVIYEEIWDGKQFVRSDSREGIEVRNGLLTAAVKSTRRKRFKDYV